LTTSYREQTTQSYLREKRPNGTKTSCRCRICSSKMRLSRICFTTSTSFLSWCPSNWTLTAIFVMRLTSMRLTCS